MKDISSQLVPVGEFTGSLFLFEEGTMGRNLSHLKPQSYNLPIRWLFSAFSIAAVIGLTLGLAIWGSHSFQNLGTWGYPGLFILGLLSSASLFFPGALLALVVPAGAIWHPFAVGLAVALGASIGEIVGYWAGAAGRTVAPSRITRLLDRGASISALGRFAGVLIAAVIPGPVFDVAGLYAGAIGMSLWQFLLATLVGKTLRFTATAALGFQILNKL